MAWRNAVKQIEQPSLFSTVTPRKVPDGIYKQLISLIASGRLKPGERLPSERAMASDLAVSRQSLREAIHRAETEGLIEVRQGGGTFVISSVRENLKPALSIMLEEQAEKIFEFLEMRKLIEGWCAEEASLAAKASDLKKMQGLLKRMETLVPGDPRWEKTDLDFHSSIAAASHNTVAVHIMEGLKDTFNQYFKAKKFTMKVERKELLLEQHQSIFEAIKQKKPGEARERVRAHLQYIEEVISRDFLKTRRKTARRSTHADHERKVDRL
jgi:GntR family transcriptional repressor for pyruvate dehydrogenase complex